MTLTLLMCMKAYLNSLSFWLVEEFEVDGELVWYDRTVLRMNTKTKEYEIQYDGEEETCWFALLDDLSAGDLVFQDE